MMERWIVLSAGLAYVGLLFLIAWLGDRRAGAAQTRRSRGAPLVYALTLAVYCTSWTFYGSVGRAATTGFDYIPIYLGPILVIGLAWPFLVKIIAVAKAQNVTSIADFIAARYGKSQAVAALVTVIAVVGAAPYVAIQLKAVAASFEALTAGPMNAVGQAPWWRDTAFYVSGAMAAFAILFGVRSIDAAEHHRGLMVAVAFESVIKLLAFLAVGMFVAYGLNDGVAEIVERAEKLPEIAKLMEMNWTTPEWWAMVATSACAFLFLPRQFHVAVVENTNVNDVRWTVWLIPLYMVAINLFVTPIALYGRMLFQGGPGIDPDAYMLAIPLAHGAQWAALVAFIGGLSAATGMVIVASVALATMVSNDLVLPLLLRRRRGDEAGGGRNPARGLLHVRRATIVVILLVAYIYDRNIAESYPLNWIGQISFAAVAQFAPPIILGVLWKGGRRAGALAGMTIGFFVWLYTLLLPSFVPTGWPPGEWLEHGPFGVAMLRPQDLFGLELGPMANGVVWSLGLNIAVYVLASLQGRSRARAIERVQADAFVGTTAQVRLVGRPWQSPVSLGELTALAARYIGPERASRAFADYAELRPEALLRADLEAVRFTERLLAGAIGAASARVVMATSLQGKNLSRRDVLAVLDSASEAIKTSRELLQATLENIGQGVCVFDADQRLVTWNQRFLELGAFEDAGVRVGLSLEELLAYNAARQEYAHPGFEGWIAQRLPAAPFSYERKRPDGRALEVASSPMPGGGFVVTFTDITERKRIEEALRDSERTIRLYTDTLPAYIAYVDRDQRLRFMNRAYEKLLGFGREQALGMTLREALGEERYLARESHVRAALAGFTRSFEIDMPGSDGALGHAEVSYVPDDGGGEVAGFFALYHDITKRRRAEEALKEANESLEQRVQERTEALEAAKLEAERANQSKTRFLAAASHDLLQPLNAARLFVSALIEQAQLPLDSRVMVENVDASLKSTEQLLGALLDISRLDAGGQKPELCDVDLGALLSALAIEFAAVARGKGLVLRAVPTKLWVRSDPRMLRRIISNFLSNAMRYTQRGRVLLGCRRVGDKVRVDVWDTGPGIPEEKRREVFQEFRRLDPDQPGSEKGLGLGLAIVDRMAAMLKHPIGLWSEVGRGACFSIACPRVAPPAPSPAAAAPRRRPAGGLNGLRVLCLDNEPTILQGMAALLGGWSCAVLTAGTLAEALRLAQDDAPHVLIADYHLDNDENGLDALDALRAVCAPDTPAILITADRTDALLESAEAHGVLVQHKPLKPGPLRALLSRLGARRHGG